MINYVKLSFSIAAGIVMAAVAIGGIWLGFAALMLAGFSTAISNAAPKTTLPQLSRPSTSNNANRTHTTPMAITSAAAEMAYLPGPSKSIAEGVIVCINGQVYQRVKNGYDIWHEKPTSYPARCVVKNY